MAIDVESLQGLGAAAVVDIGALIETKLREEHLLHFIRARDELLQLERPDDPETMRMIRRHHLHSLEDSWNIVLETLRSELPKALDQVLSSLQPGLQESESPSVRSRDAIPPSPPRLSADVPEASARISGAYRLVFSPKGTPSSKRVSDPDEPPVASASKKAKKSPQTPNENADFNIPIKRIIFSREVQPDECVFRYGGYTGVYVLRCGLSKCKKRLRIDGPLTFTSHPFDSKPPLALDHFEGEGHNIGDESEIFRKYAYRVIDADRERNTEQLNSGRPYDTYPPWMAARVDSPTGMSDASGETAGRKSTLSNGGNRGNDDDDDDELPPLESVLNRSSGAAPVIPPP